MSSPSLRPLIDTCQKCSTSPANHELRSPANGSFQNPGVCPQAVPSFPSPTPTVLFLALAPFSAQAKYRSLSLLPNPTERLAMQATHVPASDVPHDSVPESVVPESHVPASLSPRVLSPTSPSHF